MDQVESWIRAEIHTKNSSKIIIGSVYKHPNASTTQFTSEMKEILKKLNEQKYQVFIMGDIKIDFLKFNLHNPIKEYLDMLYKNNLFPLITKPPNG